MGSCDNQMLAKHLRQKSVETWTSQERTADDSDEII
jgi:hypothetical protein